MDHQNILKLAEETIFQRQGSYDKPENNFIRIADFWNTYLKSRPEQTDLTPKDVALMMVLLKIARELYSHKTDNLVDGAGYLQCAEIVEAE